MIKKYESAIIEDVSPEINCGRHSVKREAGGRFEVRANIFKDGHDVIAAVVKHLEKGKRKWAENPMQVVNPGLDRWEASFELSENTRYEYTTGAWMDEHGSWLREVDKEDFRHFVEARNEYGMEVALDFAIQCPPDHAYIKEHPEWSKFRPDGSIKYAENPPKKYENIVNVDWETEDLKNLWWEWLDGVLFWVGQDVKVLRVDNPHAKLFAFWKWLIRTVQDEHSDVIFLAEAFSRPRTMQGLGKLGFTRSYTYFTWRTEKSELIEYLTELTREEREEAYSVEDLIPGRKLTGRHGSRSWVRPRTNDNVAEIFRTRKVGA